MTAPHDSAPDRESDTMGTWIRICVSSVLAVGMVAGSAGCTQDFLTGFAAGWFTGTRGLLGTTEFTCFRNGQPVDCDTLPVDLLPAE